MPTDKTERQHRCWVELPGRKLVLVRVASHVASAAHLRPFKPGEELFVFEFFGPRSQAGLRLRVSSVRYLGELPVYRCVPVEVNHEH